MSKDYIDKKPRYQLWSEYSFIYDTRTMHWLARMLYRAALQAAWYEPTKPDLPADDSQLAAILGVPAATWDMHKDAVRAMFTLDAETGVLWQKRLRADWQELSLYREKQTANGKKGGRPCEVTDAKGYKPTAIPPLSHGKARKEGIIDQTHKSITDDDVVPSAPLGVATPGVESTATSTAPDKKQLCAELMAYVFNKTGFQSPSPKSVRDLVDQYPIGVIESALDDVLRGKDKKDVLGTVKLFFQGGAPGIILAGGQALWRDNLVYVSEHLDEETIEEYLADNPVPAGIDGSYSLIRAAHNRRQKIAASKQNSGTTQTTGVKS